MPSPLTIPQSSDTLTPGGEGSGFNLLHGCEG